MGYLSKIAAHSLTQHRFGTMLMAMHKRYFIMAHLGAFVKQHFVTKAPKLLKIGFSKQKGIASALPRAV
ncbi:MAG: hypothetical protein CUN50_02575 [Candidatus Thermofonsia Clade 1 bacterium]|jgi:hypothetical protein|uniref:Uncharacterized protein n=1 Tax=Candidatus Thermofonsia Clade 1 bacterium TaxID=2364210 RepID=A0A2M8PZ18_9CHLR|nr:MAG: hypothetical protein CUN50_02575 [Candidatus Thermofonsia Clade 1 bacterium]